MQKHFTHLALQYFLSELAEIDVEDWKRNTDYNGYWPHARSDRSLYGSGKPWRTIRQQNESRAATVCDWDIYSLSLSPSVSIALIFLPTQATTNWRRCSVYIYSSGEHRGIWRGGLHVKNKFYSFFLATPSPPQFSWEILLLLHWFLIVYLNLCSHVYHVIRK